ncbi:MAG: hypothetical protein ACREBR_00060 [bacterium]
MCIVVGGLEEGAFPPVVVRNRAHDLGGGREQLQRVHDCQGVYDVLHFVLLFPDGGEGWHPYRVNRDNDNLTLSQCYRYMLQERRFESNAVVKGRKLFLEFIVMAFARVQVQQ